MTRLLLADDPGAAHPTKNAAAPGHPTNPATEPKGHPMLGEANTRAETAAERFRRNGMQPTEAYAVLTSAVRGYLEGRGGREWLQLALSDVEGIEAEADLLVYTPRQLDALIDRITAERIEGGRF